MKWEDRGRSENLQDRRRVSGPRRAGIPLGIGGVLLVFAISALTGIDLSSLFGMSPSTPAQQSPVSEQELAAEEEQVRFVSFVLDDVQATWEQLVTGGSYPDATLVLYRDAVQSGCGVAPAAAGPFYCPNDTSVYVDLSFYDTLRERYGAPGDFAQAYVIAHEIGHHVQNIVGTLGDIRSAQQAQPNSANELSVALELQADCYAGVWAASADERGILERGDLEEGLGAAAAVGDDRLSSQAGRSVNQETFTHGSSEQRMRRFTTGFQGGDPASCDTFTATGF
ncbi:MAG TPA: neutral zinc metallopeptidase [Trueperaceae bacterium]|nr:neutral zinc metallopeptidase [Trueperaceae bacterium]